MCKGILQEQSLGFVRVYYMLHTCFWARRKKTHSWMSSLHLSLSKSLCMCDNDKPPQWLWMVCQKLGCPALQYNARVSKNHKTDLALLIPMLCSSYHPMLSLQHGLWSKVDELNAIGNWQNKVKIRGPTVSDSSSLSFSLSSSLPFLLLSFIPSFL